ncbi:MAG TPA: glycosyltransferase family 4 protein [Acidimicrobiales bacterium]|nr:glycosyltransferase family 4 protein [Acidimicrobiales bacterium]
MPGRIAFVPPRFGAGVVGGSEALSQEIAIGLSGRGWDVEILTTCAVDHYTWDNALPPGDTTEFGLPVRRFETAHHLSHVTTEVQRAIEAGSPISLDKQLNWLSGRFSVPDLFQHLLLHGAAYDAVIFSPYLFWTTTVCMPVVRDRAIVIPCLHDEGYARLDVIRPVLSDPRAVWFLSEPEHDVAHRLGPVADHHVVTGAGVNPPEGYDPAGFCERHGIKRPFALYAGRREADKGWDWLQSTFADALALGGPDLDLVTIGVGKVTVPARLHGRVIDLGFLEDDERDNALAAAQVYLQPSRMESFSRSVMEAWLAGTPVLAVKGGEVVAWHCRRSGGGLTFSGPDDLVAGLREICETPGRAEDMAARGRDYVLKEYSWPAVLDRMEAELGASCRHG